MSSPIRSGSRAKLRREVLAALTRQVRAARDPQTERILAWYQNNPELEQYAEALMRALHRYHEPGESTVPVEPGTQPLFL